MATSSQGRLASASMSALNSLHQFPPVLCSPTRTHKREKKGGKQERKGIKATQSDGGGGERKKERGEETKD